MDEMDARKMVAGLLEALRHTHNNGVLHRDLKLDNIAWDPDFGLSGLFEEEVPLDEGVGCVNYASPSLLKLTNTDTPYLPQFGHQDLWSLGVVAYGAMTSYFPFASEKPRELAREIDPEGKPIRAKGISELALDFIRIVLDPRNEGKMDAGLLLQHPWVSPFASSRPASAKAKSVPKIPSPIVNLEGATRVVRRLLAVELPEVLGRSAGLFEESDDSSGSDTADEDERLKKVTLQRRQGSIRAAQLAAFS